MPRASLTPDAVIGLAARIADRDGFDAVSVSAVAREAGVRPASMYGHVRDRGALLEGLHRRALGDLAARIAAAVAGRSGRSALEALTQAYRRFAAERPGAWASLQRPASVDTMRSEEAATLAGYTLAALRGYDLAPDDAVHATRLVAATVQGYLVLDGVGAFAARAPGADESWTTAVDALDRALSTWPSPKETPRP